MTDLYAHEGLVRWHLRRLGVPPSALDDLTQEVWLIAMAQSPSFADEKAKRVWIAEVCRRLASSERRRRLRTAALDPEVTARLSAAPGQVEALLRESEERASEAALARLDTEQLDVVALHGSGELPMRVVASLVGATESTVYSRYRAALVELMRGFRRNSLVNPSKLARVVTSEADEPALESALHGSGGPVSEALEREADQGTFVVYFREPEYTLGRIGNVLVTLWRTRTYERTIKSLAVTMTRVSRRLGQRVVLVNLAGGELAFPNESERKTFFEQIRMTKGFASALVDVVGDLGAPQLLISIVKGILALTRVHLLIPVAFVNTVDEAQHIFEEHARCKNGPLAWEKVRHAVHTVYELSGVRVPGRAS